MAGLSLNPSSWGRKNAPARPAERKALSFPYSGSTSQFAPYHDGWDVERAVSHAVNRVVWVYKSVHAISSNAAALPLIVRKEDPDTGDIIKTDPWVRLWNRKPNPYQDAFTFRYMLSSQILLSRQGAFVQIERDRIGRPKGLYIQPPHQTYVIPDESKFVNRFEVRVPGKPTKVIKPEDMVWLGFPDPLNPYKRLTPLDSAGLSVEIDWYARLFNRNFLMNDGRPGGILLVDGELDDDDVEELRRRFLGNTGSALGGAGRVSVIEAEKASFVDTATSARDGQYMEARDAAKVETLVAFGVPESVIGNASGRSFENADAELEVFWRETMKNHLRLISTGLTGAYDYQDEDSDAYVVFDLSRISILGRDERERQRFHLEELRQQAISADEYRALTDRDPAGATRLWMPVNYMPVADVETGEAIEAPAKPALQPGAPSPARIGPEQPESVTAAAQEGGKALPEPAFTDVPELALPSLALPEKEEAARRADAEVKEAEIKEAETKAAEMSAATQALKAEADRRVARWEKTFAGQVKRLLDRQERVVLEKLTGRKARTVFEKTGSIDPTLIFDRKVWDAQLAEDGRVWIEAVAEDFGADTAERVGGVYSVEANQKNLDNQVERLLKVNQTTFARVADAIAEGLAEGGDLDTIATKVRDFYAGSADRSNRIAQTEVITAANAASFTVATAAEGVATKTWLAAPDARDAHAAVDGKTVAIHEPFDVGGEALAHPGDTAGSPSNLVNCRCVLHFGGPPVPVTLVTS